MREPPIIDCHTHLFWYPDHLSDQYAGEALASKLVKLKRSGGLAYSANLDKHCYDAKPEDHWRVSQPVHKVVVFGLQAKASGIWVPNEIIADYAAAHPEKIEGWASVDPTDPACIEQLDHAVQGLKLRGLKLGPVYQHFDPQDRKYWPLFRKCQQIQSAHHVAPGHNLSKRGAAEVGASIATGRHRNGFSGSAHDHRAPGPPLGDGRDGLNTEMSERLYRYQRSALPPMAILAGSGDSHGIWRRAQDPSGIRLSVSHTRQCHRRFAKRECHRRRHPPAEDSSRGTGLDSVRELESPVSSVGLANVVVRE